MGDPLSVVLATTVWILKCLFIAGWHAASLVTWLTWPIWACIFSIGFVCGLL